MAIKMIWAQDSNGLIGKNGTIPWDVPGDRKFFREKTLNHIVVMGRKTWESLPKLLDGRTNVVLTRQKDYEAKGAVVLGSLDEALDFYAEHGEPREHMWIIGGAEIYEEFMPHASEILITQIQLDTPGEGVYAPILKRSDWNYEGYFTPLSFQRYIISKYTRRWA